MDWHRGIIFIDIRSNINVSLASYELSSSIHLYIYIFHCQLPIVNWIVNWIANWIANCLTLVAFTSLPPKFLGTLRPWSMWTPNSPCRNLPRLIGKQKPQKPKHVEDSLQLMSVLCYWSTSRDPDVELVLQHVSTSVSERPKVRMIVNVIPSSSVSKFPVH